ncbi:Uncharacterised protein [Acinetobacter baumannii]|nr:Uncharacterised protein [Acinetobacter baumannii]
MSTVQACDIIDQSQTNARPGHISYVIEPVERL